MSSGVGIGRRASNPSGSATQPARLPKEPGALRVLTMTDPRGVHDFPGVARVIVSVHLGTPTHVACERGGERHRGRAVHGDIDIIPAGMRSLWTNEGRDTVLVLSLAPQVLQEVVETCGRDARRLQVSNRFQVRDAPIEHMAWALQSEMDAGFPCGRLFLDSMATALAIQLVHRHSSLAVPQRFANGAMPARRLKDVLCHIEDNLASGLSLEEIAQVARLSVSQCKVLFRQSMGLPIYQYVIRRRVERAAALLREDRLPISQIALESGFSHQSHLARHMRRVLGTSPKTYRNASQ